MSIEVQTFNASGDVIACETFRSDAGAMKLARIAFKMDCGVAINGNDCFSFAEVERALRQSHAEEVMA